MFLCITALYFCIHLHDCQSSGVLKTKAGNLRVYNKIFLEPEPGDFSCTAFLSSMLFLTVFSEVILQLIKTN